MIIGNGWAPNMRQAITCNYANPVDWRIYAALEGYGFAIAQERARQFRLWGPSNKTFQIDTFNR